ncbi:hypothetical protein [Nocardiopsis potens]|uniref:hypothetical protein n=1 Tax=Nocardiopsis potens TaxID=1246458 RepID=UPI00034539D3|nr:hypothetical protein [Nocardiopsis potens]
MDVSQLAMEGASVLVQSMLTDLWQGVRPRFAALFGKGEDTVGEELEQVRAEIDEGETEPEDVEQEWAARLRRVLKNDPEAAEALRAIIDEAAPRERPSYSSVNTVTGGSHENLTQIGYVGGNSYVGDHVDMRGIRAQRDAIGKRYDRGPHRED